RMDSAPDAAAALALARRHLPDAVLVGAPLRIWRQRPAAEAGMLDIVTPAEGWAFIAFGAAAEPLGLMELRGEESHALAVAEHPWLAHALLLGLAQAALPIAEGCYLGAFSVAGAAADRALVADCLDHELVVPLHPGAEVMHGLEFAAWLHGLADG
ncbi:MAG: hypothetical protein K2X74_00260, partial [Acetobacteraceae bacterium]|nr:hypothetical protein [Acetobacteraceae bacterium]